MTKNLPEKNLRKMPYRLALDLGSTSLGWAIIRLDEMNHPVAVIRSGVRIFSSGRDSKTNASLAVARREARSMRRRRDRYLNRRQRIMRLLMEYGLFPTDVSARKALERLDPYDLRRRGLDELLQPYEFGRAIFHLNQRRGFRSNRKTDAKDSDGSVMKTAIKKAREIMEHTGCRTAGEWLHTRLKSGLPVRARYRQKRVHDENGKSRLEKSYDLYLDRSMLEMEFDMLWARQAELNPELYTEDMRFDLRETLFFQRELKPVRAGRCTLLPDEERSPQAMPCAQRIRIYQEINHLRILESAINEKPLTLAQRDAIVGSLEKNRRQTFTQIRRLLGLNSTTRFNLEDPKRQELKGNETSALLGRDEYFGKTWFEFPEEKQDQIVWQLLTEESEAGLHRWLQEETGVDEERAQRIADARLPEGHSNLSITAIHRIFPELRKDILTYDKAVVAAGFDHHSHIDPSATGEILPELPYYGIPLQRHVGFGSGEPGDLPEKRYGRIANPTVHIGLNQVCVVVNALIKRYGHPSQVVIEVARELKRSQEKRNEIRRTQALNQAKNAERRADIARIQGISEYAVKRADIQKWALWEELHPDPMERCCPYTGEKISSARLFSPEVEIEHILPFSRTLDDSMNNKIVSMRRANRLKGNLTPWEAFGQQHQEGFDYDAILERASRMPIGKRYRFGEDAYEKWLKTDGDFLARALNDTSYLSRMAGIYLRLICPDTWVIPGRLTAMLRHHFGLNGLLGLQGEKNRDDHRHHAVDACVIGVTDRALLQKIARASASSREKQLERIVDGIVEPWAGYRDHVLRAIEHIKVSHKPEHSHEGAMHNDTAYGLREGGMVTHHKVIDGERKQVHEKLDVIPFSDARATDRHGLLPDGSPRPYKGYKGDSNYCIEIVKNEKNRWVGEVVSTFAAYQVVRKLGPVKGIARLRDAASSLSGKPLVMRLMRNDCVQLDVDGVPRIMRVVSIWGSGLISLAELKEANADARNRDKEESFSYTRRTAGSLQRDKARFATVSPDGRLRVYKFKG